MSTNPLTPKPPRLTAASAPTRWAAKAAWRVLNPADRGPFLAGPRPPLLPRIHAETPDGWHLPLLRLRPKVGGSGEPVVLLHGAGLSPDAYRYGDQTLPKALAEAGFQVYLACHRADPGALAPRGAAPTGIDAIAELDLPAILAAAAADAGHARVHLVGHGLGALLALGVASARCEHLATVVSLGASLRLEGKTQLRRAASLARVLPSEMARMLVPVLGHEHFCGMVTTTERSKLRGVLAHGMLDSAAELHRDLAQWLACGAPRFRGINLADQLVEAEVPLLAIAGGADPHGSVESLDELAVRFGHDDITTSVAQGLGHWDLCLAENNPAFAMITGWLDSRRRVSWRRGAMAC